jgi:transcriptional regulator with XRE-family HTH domain
MRISSTAAVGRRPFAAGGRLLADARRAAGLSQAAIARACGQAWPSWASQIETGVMRLPWAMVGRWAEACGREERRLAWALLRAYEPDLYDALTARGRPRPARPALLALPAPSPTMPLLEAIAAAEREAGAEDTGRSA